MLKLNVRRRWRPWADQGKDVKLLLSPLTSSRRTELLEQATESPDSEKNPRRRATARLNQKKYQDLVADECVHGWEGLARSEEHTSELQSLMRNSYAVF